MPALYSPTGDEWSTWQTVDLLGAHKSGRLVVREIGKLWPGVFLADRHQVALIVTDATVINRAA